MTDADREKWDRKYAGKTAHSVPAPDQWLIDCVKALPPGCALDLACGLGQNALQLAEWGWNVDAVDISEVGLKLPQEISGTLEFPVNWVCADLDDWQPRKQYDLIVVFRFLDWSTVPRIIRQCLKPGGYLCYETFSESQCSRPDSHLNNPAFTICEGDLETYFSELLSLSERTESLEDRDVVRYFGQRAMI